MTSQELAELRDRLAEEYASRPRCAQVTPNDKAWHRLKAAYIEGFCTCEREVAAPLRAELERKLNIASEAYAALLVEYENAEKERKRLSKNIADIIDGRVELDITIALRAQLADAGKQLEGRVLLERKIVSLEAALGKAETEEKALSRQITECMEFLIWLRGYEFIDGPIEDRLVKLLEALSSVQAGRGMEHER